jgi:hypothetical protein
MKDLWKSPRCWRVKAIVRAHRWRDTLESGDYATVRDLAKSEAINESYLNRRSIAD